MRPSISRALKTRCIYLKDRKCSNVNTINDEIDCKLTVKESVASVSRYPGHPRSKSAKRNRERFPGHFDRNW